LYSPYEFNWKRDLDFPDGENTHTAAVKIFNFGLHNVLGDGYDADNAAAAEEQIYKIYAIAAIRSAIKYSKKASSSHKYLAEGWAYWRSASGYISQTSAESKTTVQEIDALFGLGLDSVPESTHCAVKEKVESLYPALGLTCAMVGKWKDDDGSCDACNDAGATGTLHGGSTDYVDMCMAAPDRSPKLSDGDYCPVNDVSEHADINEDVKEIATKLKEDPPNYGAAKTIYTDGMYSSKGGNKMRTLQDMAKKDMSKGGTVVNDFYDGFVDLYGSYENVWDKYIMECFDGTGACEGKDDDFKKYVINKGLIGIVTGYVTYEMGSGLAKAADGETGYGEAAYAWDEAAAFHIGNEPCESTGATASAICSLYSPYEFNWKRDLDFPDGENTHTAAVKIFNFGLHNVLGHKYDAANAAAAEEQIYKIYAIAAIRSAIKYSKKASSSHKYLAEGWAYWRSASGYISQISAESKTTVQEIDALFDLGLDSVPESTHCDVKQKVESMYPALGLTCAMVGTWKDDDGTCLACSDGGATGALHEGSTDYIDWCVDPSSDATPPTPATPTSPTPSPSDSEANFAIRITSVAAVMWAAITLHCML